jgi:hypothetical protein
MPQKSNSRWTFVTLALSVTFLLISSVATAAETFVIVSDVDDTVRVTDVRHPAQAPAKALASKLVFAGMPELYAQMLGPGSGSERLRFISGSPGTLDHKIAEMLIASQFPAHNLTQRGPGASGSSVRYFKSERMKALYGQSRETFILIGDDTEFDPEVYTDFAAAMPGQVRSIYIRRITGRQLPTGCVPFVTAYDIAVEERLAGHMSKAQAAAVGRAVLASPDRTLLPGFQICPGDNATVQRDVMQNEIWKRLSHLCTAGTLPQPSSP